MPDMCRLYFHYEAERVTGDERVYPREGPPRLVQMMLDSPQPAPAQLAEEQCALLAAEKECLQVGSSSPCCHTGTAGCWHAASGTLSHDQNTKCWPALGVVDCEMCTMFP